MGTPWYLGVKVDIYVKDIKKQVVVLGKAVSEASKIIRKNKKQMILAQGGAIKTKKGRLLATYSVEI